MCMRVRVGGSIGGWELGWVGRGCGFIREILCVCFPVCFYRSPILSLSLSLIWSPMLNLRV